MAYNVGSSEQSGASKDPNVQRQASLKSAENRNPAANDSTFSDLPEQWRNAANTRTSRNASVTEKFFAGYNAGDALSADEDLYIA